MGRTLGICAALLALSACTKTPDRARDDAQFDVVARTPVYEWVQQIEPSVLALPGVDAERDGDRLVLRPRTAPPKIYQDRPGCDRRRIPDPDWNAGCWVFVLLVHAPSLGVSVVGQLFYEAADFLVVDIDTGRETVVAGMPAFSPAGDRFVAVDGYIDEPSIVRVWRRDGDGFALEWQGEPYRADAADFIEHSFIAWIDDSVIAFEADVVRYVSRSFVEETIRFDLRRTNGGWSVVERGGGD